MKTLFAHKEYFWKQETYLGQKDDSFFVLNGTT